MSWFLPAIAILGFLYFNARTDLQGKRAGSEAYSRRQGRGESVTAKHISAHYPRSYLGLRQQDTRRDGLQIPP